MIQDLKPYPEYKDSGVPWLGKIPKNWILAPGRACFKEKKIPNIGLKETTVLSLSYGKIVVKPEDKLHGLVPASFETYQVVDPGDIIVRPTDLQNDWVSLRFGLSQNRGIITSAYMNLQTEPVLTQEYGHLLLHSYDLKKIFYGLGSGLRQNLDWKDFKYLPCLVPPLPEQIAIVRYLTYMDRRINRYIRAKKKLIALLNEQKQAIIQQALTRSLDPTVHLKSSGVEWLGDLPEHWNIQRFKFLAQINNGQVDPRQDAYVDCPLIAPNHIESGTGRLLFVESARNQGASSGKYLVKKNQIIYSKIRPNLRKAIISPVDGLCSADMYAISPINEKIHSDFLLEIMLSKPFTKFAVDTSLRVAMPKINRDALGNCPIWFPDLAEQTSIMSFIVSVSKPYQETILRIKDLIEMVESYYRRLIIDIVTGKLDVCDAAAVLPDELEDMIEPEEPEEDEESDKEGEVMEEEA